MLAFDSVEALLTDVSTSPQSAPSKEYSPLTIASPPRHLAPVPSDVYICICICMCVCVCVCVCVCINIPRQTRAGAPREGCSHTSQALDLH